MRTNITFSLKNRLYFLCLVASAIFLNTACQNDNIVGSSFIPVEPNIKVDTLLVGGFEPQNLKTFTGNLAFFSAGMYQDELFGDVSAKGFLAPGLVPSTVFNIFEDAEMYILMFPQRFYGNQSGSITLGIHFVENRWRATATDKDSEIQFNPVPFETITIDADSDSIAIRLPQEWVDRYDNEFFYFDEEDGNRDTNLVENEFGFAIVPIQGDIVSGISGTNISFDQFGAINYSGTRLLVRNPIPGEDNGDGDNTLLNDEDVEFEEFPIPFRGWAYTYDVDNQPNLETSHPVYNTFEKVVGFDLSDTFALFQDQNISRAELVLFEDEDVLNNTLPTGHERLESGRIQLYRLESVDLDFIVTRAAIFEPLRNNNDGSFRINLTETIRNIQLGAVFQGRLYISSGPNNGLFTPNLIVTDTTSIRSPKLIITRLDPQEN